MRARWLGRVPYARAVELQESLVSDRRAGREPDTLLLLEHPPVVTLGRSGDSRHLLADPETLARKGIELHSSRRGGDATYHGPGQLVGYPILALEPSRRDAHRYLRDIEESLIRTAADFGVRAARVEGLTGIWVGRDKLGAIGVRISTGWIASHGFALNVDPDLDGFSHIVPCGIRDRGVTSLGRLIGTAPALRRVAARAAFHLAEVMQRIPIPAGDAAERLPAPGTRSAGRGARAW